MMFGDRMAFDVFVVFANVIPIQNSEKDMRAQKRDDK